MYSVEHHSAPIIYFVFVFETELFEAQEIRLDLSTQRP